MQKTGKILLASILAFVLLLGAGIALIVGILTTTPDFSKMRGAVSVPIQLKDKTKSKRLVGPRAPGWVKIADISNHLLMAVIASEDASFFSHEGVDYHELKEAMKKDIEEKRWARGASTLTQQVVKNVYLSQEKTLSRKFRELLWAREMDKSLSKSEILCFYVNMAEWGKGLYGIGAASWHYFQVAPADLTARQGAFLAMLLPSPRKYESYYHKKELTPWAHSRVNQILRVMNRMGFLEEGAYQAALQEKLWLKPEEDTSSVAREDAEEPSSEPYPDEFFIEQETTEAPATQD